MAKILQNEIQSLPADQREVLLLSKYSSLSYDEISQIIGSTPAAAKQKAYRAMLFLKQKLKNYNGPGNCCRIVIGGCGNFLVIKQTETGGLQ